MARPRKQNSHLPPCLHQKHGAYYYVKNGAWKRLGATLTEALVGYAELVEMPAGTMPAVIEDALSAMRARTPPLASSTLAQYTVAAKILKRKLKQFRPEQVQQKHVAGIKVAMASTPNMGNRCLSFLRQVFDYALEQGLIASNPAIGVKRHKEAKRKRVPSQEEYAAVCAHAGSERLQVVAELLRYTGQRVEDVLHIQIAHLTEAGILFDPEKTGKPFYAAWTPELRGVVDRAKALRGRARSPALKWLLQGRRGKPPNYRSVKEQWDRACLAAGIEDLHLHDLRAMCLTQAKREGLDPQALGRHSSPQMTERYLRDREIPVIQTPSFRQSNRQQ